MSAIVLFFFFLTRWSERGNIRAGHGICWCTTPQCDGNVPLVLLEPVSYGSGWLGLRH